MRKLIDIHCASPIGEEDPPQLLMEADIPIPTGDTLEVIRDIMDSDAEKVVDALCSTLPQGTTDRILAQLMQRKASVLIGAQK